jgi:ferrous iron transport protein B
MSTITIALVGNPNCGKSTLFNALTGARQKVGNWPGVTVACKSGYYLFQQQPIQVVDLPGIYQLCYSQNSQALDEKIACDYILNHPADIIVNILDAAHLERHLFLTLQLLALGIPIILAVNMMDVAKRRQITLHLDNLAQMLGCPVVGLVANKGIGVAELKQRIANFDANKFQPIAIDHPCLAQAIATLTKSIQYHHHYPDHCAKWLAQQLLNQNVVPNAIHPEILTMVQTLQANIVQELGEELDVIFADFFYSRAHHIAQTISLSKTTEKTLTERIDKIVINRFWGIPIFLLAMYGMFLFAINLGGAFQDFFDITSDAIFVHGTGQILQAMHAPGWLLALLASGFGRGINTTVTFIPVIAAMFFFLAFLESSGFMARASFVIDRLMRLIGLPGKSFVPMIVGFGCNVPAILAARTLENPRDRALTILMSPFMSCGARLAIFAVFTAAFFPIGGQNVVFALYLIGILAAILTGFMLRNTLLQGSVTPLVLELPAYHMPTMTVLLMQTWLRLKSFIFGAGKLIIPICMLIGMLNAVNLDGSLNQQTSNSASVLASVGKLVTPVFAPMGIKEDNWPATVGLVTGVLAKEVVVGTLNTLYSQEAHLALTKVAEPNIAANLKDAVFSVPNNLMRLKDSFGNPVIASAPEHTLSHHVYGIMFQKFQSRAGAFAYLLFVLLYFPCVSATAVMAKELSKKWALFSVAWSTCLAYGVATCFYQLATFNAHRTHSSLHIMAIVISFGCFLAIMRRYSLKQAAGEVTYVAN